jgi:homoserine kinase
MSQPFEPFSRSVPATSANLGPGFDSVGISLGLRLHADVESAEAFELRFAPGRHAPTHAGLGDGIVAAMERVSPSLPKARVTVTNNIPLGKGLGSSAAAAVLGIAVAARAHGIPLPKHDVARLASLIEGHPDNALPAVFGGAVIASSHERFAYVRVPLHRELRALIVVPDVDLATASSRALLPDSYLRADVVFTAQRAALLGAALASGSWNELRAAMCDRLHQPFRAPHIPGMSDALALESRHVLGIAISGAGPSVIALMRAEAPWRKAAGKLEECFTRAGVASHTLRLRIGGRGVAA